MKGQVGDKQRLLHILEAITEIQSYIGGKDAIEFRSNSMLKFASIKQLEIIGEATRFLTDVTKQKFVKVEWVQIVALRNVLVHEYFGIDSDLIWQIIETDIPAFKEEIQAILNSLE